MIDIAGFAAVAAEVLDRIGPGEPGEPTTLLTISRIGGDTVSAYVVPSPTLDARQTSRLLALVADTVAAEARVSPREVHCASSHPDDGPVLRYLLVATIGGGR